MTSAFFSHVTAASCLPPQSARPVQSKSSSVILSHHGDAKRRHTSRPSGGHSTSYTSRISTSWAAATCGPGIDMRVGTSTRALCSRASDGGLSPSTWRRRQGRPPGRWTSAYSHHPIQAAQPSGYQNGHHRPSLQPQLDSHPQLGFPQHSSLRPASNGTHMFPLGGAEHLGAEPGYSMHNGASPFPSISSPPYPPNGAPPISPEWCLSLSARGTPKLC